MEWNGIREALRRWCCDYSPERNNRVRKNSCLGFTYRLLFVLIIVSIVLIVFLSDGYMKESHEFMSSVEFRIYKGIRTSFAADEFLDEYTQASDEWEMYNKQWDPVDFVKIFPNEIQVTTNIAITRQNESTCFENPLESTINAECGNHKCTEGALDVHGVQTGKCVRVFNKTKKMQTIVNGVVKTIDIEPTLKTCEIKGWCPIARNFPPFKGPKAVFIDTQNLVLLVNNFVYFPQHNITLDNLSKTRSSSKSNCLYHPEAAPWCPYFTLKEIVNNFTLNTNMQYDEMAILGGAIQISIIWRCKIEGFCLWDDLCWLIPNSLYDCSPEYKFHRTDLTNSLVALYPYVHYFNGSKTRIYYHTYRIRFPVSVWAEINHIDINNALTEFGAKIPFVTMFSAVFLIFVTTCCCACCCKCCSKKCYERCSKYRLESDHLELNKVVTFSLPPEEDQINKNDAKQGKDYQSIVSENQQNNRLSQTNSLEINNFGDMSGDNVKLV